METHALSQRTERLAITIRNKETEDLIRTIGRRTGEGPSAVIRRLARKEVIGHEADGVSREEVERRRAFMANVRRRYPPPEPGTSWKEVEDEMDSIFGDDFE